jgi:hypothetical protein
MHGIFGFELRVPKAAALLVGLGEQQPPSIMSIQIVSPRRFLCIAVFILASGWRCFAQEPTQGGTPTPSPSPYSAQILGDLKNLQQAALASDYAYRQVAHLANNIGPRLTGSIQAQKSNSRR